MKFKLPKLRIPFPHFPSAVTFEDGQRLFFGFMLVLAGVSFGVMGGWLTYTLIFGPWSAESETLRLYLLGGALMGYFVGQIAVTISMAVGGPVGRFKVNVTKDGANLEADGDGVAPSAAPAPAAPPVMPTFTDDVPIETPAQ